MRIKELEAQIKEERTCVRKSTAMRAELDSKVVELTERLEQVLARSPRGTAG